MQSFNGKMGLFNINHTIDPVCKYTMTSAFFFSFFKSKLKQKNYLLHEIKTWCHCKVEQIVNGKEKRQKFPQRPFYRDKEMTQNGANKRHDAKRTDAIYYNIIKWSQNPKLSWYRSIWMHKTSRRVSECPLGYFTSYYSLLMFHNCWNHMTMTEFLSFQFFLSIFSAEYTASAVKQKLGALLFG